MAIRSAINQLKKEIKCTVSTSKAELELHGQNATGLPEAPPDAVLYPENTQQVSEIMKVCNEHECPIVAYGIGSSLEGHHLAIRGGISLNMSKMIEIQQLIQLIQPAISVLKNMSLLVVVIAAFSMFVAMFNSLKDRKYEIALMRVAGARKGQVFISILFEGLILSLIGYVLGLLISHVGMEIFSIYLSESYHYDFTGFLWLEIEWWLLLGAVIIGMISALYPAYKAYKIDISKTLSTNEL